MKTLNIPEFNEKGEHIGYITVNTKYIKYWSISNTGKVLSIKIELTDNITFNRFYNYDDKSELNLSNLKLFKDLVFSLNKLGSEEQFYSNCNISRIIYESKSLDSIESKERNQNTVNKTLLGKRSDIRSGYFKCLTVVGSTVIAGSGSNGGLYYSEDNGHTWKHSNIQSDDFHCLITIGSTVIAGSDSGKGLYYSEDNGKTWNRSNIQTGSFWCLTVVGSTVIAGGHSDKGLYYSEDNGKTWNQSDIQTGDFRCLTIIGSTVIAGSWSDKGLYYLD